MTLSETPGQGPHVLSYYRRGFYFSDLETFLSCIFSITLIIIFEVVCGSGSKRPIPRSDGVPTSPKNSYVRARASGRPESGDFLWHVWIHNPTAIMRGNFRRKILEGNARVFLMTMHGNSRSDPFCDTRGAGDQSYQGRSYFSGLQRYFRAA